MPPIVRITVCTAVSGWRRAITPAMANFTRATLKTLVLPLPLAVRYTNDAEMRDLNRYFRGKDKATNVLSFPAHDSEYLGDIALGLETVMREAADQGKTATAHTAHLLVHGALHLLGFDHETDDDAAIMQAKEIDILKNIGYDDPYA